MLRKSSKSLLTGFTVLTLGIFSQFASAVPQYLTFSGEVDYVRDSAGIAASSGVGLGTAVNYTYLIDRDLPGQVAFGSTAYDLNDTRRVDSFYVDFIGGSLITSSGVSTNIEFNVGQEVDLRRSDYTQLIGDTAEDQTSVFTRSSDALSTIGSIWSGFEIAFNSVGRYSAVGSLLRLTGISGTNPGTNPVSVPELDASSGLIIFALLAAIIGIRMERRKVQVTSA